MSLQVGERLGAGRGTPAGGPAHVTFSMSSQRAFRPVRGLPMAVVGHASTAEWR